MKIVTVYIYFILVQAKSGPPFMPTAIADYVILPLTSFRIARPVLNLSSFIFVSVLNMVYIILVYIMYDNDNDNDNILFDHRHTN